MATITPLDNRLARSIDTVIIGAGQAGLAMSRVLTDRNVDHVLLERGEVANSWRTERWDSLRLLTPNWQTRLPGFRYDGVDPDGYMTMSEVASFFDRYADSFDAPVQTNTNVFAVRPGPAGFEVETDRGSWAARAVVMASGACSTPNIPGFADDIDPAIDQISPIDYRNPDQLAPGGVLIVGASASGLQLADELRRAGRSVTLAVGAHTRLPRTYRGMDTQWWLDASGALDQHYTEVADLTRARRQPSLQLVGTPDQRTLDLQVLARAGVTLVGRVETAAGATVRFADDLPLAVADADRRLGRLLDRFDAFAAEGGLDDELLAPERPTPISVDAGPTTVDLEGAGITTIIWATGFRPHYPWLEVPVLDDRGELRHDGGVVDWPGLYALGLPFLRRRRSTFIDGAAADATDLGDHLTRFLRHTTVAAEAA